MTMFNTKHTQKVQSTLRSVTLREGVTTEKYQTVKYVYFYLQSTVYSIQYTVHCIQYTVHCIQYTVHCSVNQMRVLLSCVLVNRITVCEAINRNL